MRKNEDGAVLAVSFLNRVGDVTMEGTYGYVKKSLRTGGAMLTATSTIREFVFEKMDERDIAGLGKVPCFTGTDYYGRELVLPIQRIRGIILHDTEKQGILKGFNWIVRTFEELRTPPEQLTEEQEASVQQTFKEFKDKRDELVSSGVTEYVPRRAQEDEL